MRRRRAARSERLTAGEGSADAGTVTIRVPKAALGNPTASSLLESTMAFVTASPQSGVVPQNNGTDFLDIAPLQLEGTKAVNVKLGAAGAVPPAVVPPGTGPGENPPGAAPPSRDLAATGLGTALPLVAVALVLGALAVTRRRRAY